MNNTLNSFKTVAGRAGIGAFRFLWYAIRIMKQGNVPAKEHYYIMRLFRSLFRSYQVRIAYPNPLAPGHKLRLRLNLCENSHQWYFRERGSYDALEIGLIGEAMSKADMFLDIGANIGIYATTIAQAYPPKQIAAFEPLPRNFQNLQANIAANGLGNCRPRQCAVSGAGKPLPFFVNPIHDGGGSLNNPGVYRTGDVLLDAKAYQAQHPEFQSFIEVETLPLDDVITMKSVLKIDVEGAEVDVLRSGFKKLKEGLVDFMAVEILEETGDEVVTLAQELGFDSFLLPDLVPMKAGMELPWFVRNIVCVKRNTDMHRDILRRIQK